MTLPSIWGRHQVARIDPVFVRGTMVSTVSQAPEGWDERLQALGFKRTHYGWARLGAIAQSEFAYLSPEIDLVGFRLDMAIEAPANDEEPSAVPFDVRDEVLRIWQRRYPALETAMLLEHGQPRTRGAIWTHVEDALAGRITSESETVLSLAIEVLRPHGLSAEAQAFDEGLAAWRGGTGSSQRSVSRGVLILRQGSAVSWAEKSGVVVEGRLARPLYSADPAAIAYEACPAWVGGYPLVAPKRIPRSAIFFNDAAHDFTDEDLAQAGNKAEIKEPAPAEQPEEPIPAVPENVLRHIEKQLVRGGFLSSANDEWKELLKISLSGRFTQEEVDAGMAWTEAVLKRLDVVAAKQFPGQPIGLELTAFYGEEMQPTLAASPAVIIGTEVFRSQRGPAAALLGASGELQLDAAGEKLANSVQERMQHVERSASLLGEQAGGGRAVPFRAMASIEPMLQALSAGRGAAIDEEMVLLAMSVALRSPDLVEFVERQALNSELDFSRHEAESLALSMSAFRMQANLLHLGEMTALMRSGPAQRFDLRPIAVSEITSYVVLAQSGREAIRNLEPQGITPSKPGRLTLADWSRVVFHKDMEAALAAYSNALLEYRDFLPQAYRQDVDQHRAMLQMFPVWEEVQSIPNRLAELGEERLYELAEADFLRLGGDKAASISVANRKSLLGTVMRTALKKGVWGVAIELKSRNAYIHPISMSLAMLGETRAAVMSAAVADIKRRGGRSTVLPFDTIAWAAPELVARINGHIAPASPAAAPQAAAADAAGGAGGYVDTGVVAGWAPKDLRAFDRAQLVSATDAMTDDQKRSYITKELLWPRRSFDEMKELGVEVKVALLHDIIWKAVDAKPKSLVRAHVGAFIQLIQSFRELDSALNEPLSSYIGQLNKITSSLFNPTNADFRNLYRRADLRIRGTRTSLIDPLDLVYARPLSSQLDEARWENLVKAKKRASSGGAASRVARDEVSRVGPDYRNGQSVSGEDFIRTFGFSGVEYGNWTNQKEREKHLNFAYDSMMDFATKMGWVPMALSLGGKLGLCIGSRGRGGPRAANAHFEPVNMAINLTRMRGDGALAHEFFHAVACHYGRLLSGQVLDLADAIAYPMRDKRSRQPDAANPRGELRGEVLIAFHDLMTAIMRAPKEPGAGLECFTEPSKMLQAALVEDGKKAAYWSKPAEMFARAAEVWFAKIQEDAGHRNDYLVRAGKLGSESNLYPSREQLEIIDPLFRNWVSSLKTEMRQVVHPFLGDIQMPVLNTEIYSKQPLAPMDLALLAEEQLSTLFRSIAPSLEVVDDPLSKPGYYDLARNIIGLNARFADAETFAHEAWHAAYSVLLTHDERVGLDAAFAVNSPLAEKVAAVMRAEGHLGQIEHMFSSAQEVQAYAYQLWSAGKLELGSSPKEFGRCKQFVDGVLDVQSAFGEAAVLEVFERFKSGELAKRAELKAQAAEDADWDEENIIWNLDVPVEPPRRGTRLHFG